MLDPIPDKLRLRRGAGCLRESSNNPEATPAPVLVLLPAAAGAGAAAAAAGAGAGAGAIGAAAGVAAAAGAAIVAGGFAVYLLVSTVGESITFPAAKEALLLAAQETIEYAETAETWSNNICWTEEAVWIQEVSKAINVLIQALENK